METLANSIAEFSYDPDNGLTFTEWYSRHEDVFLVDGKDLDDASRVRLLLRKLDGRAYHRYANFILPKKPRELKFDDTTKVLGEIFARKVSLFATRYNCLKNEKIPSDDFQTYAGIINRQCEEFQLTTITADQFKCLMFVCGLTSANDADIRTRLLAKIEAKTDLTLKDLSTECDRIIRLKHDTALIENRPLEADIKAVQKKSKSSRQNPKTPCWYCGGMHYADKCWYKSHKCSDCGKLGHKEGFCDGMRTNTKKRSLERKRKDKERKSNRAAKSSDARTNSIFSVSKVDYALHRKYIEVDINNTPTRLQIDTASDITVISENSWKKLGRPKTTPTTHAARNASGEPLTLIAEFQCTVLFRGKEVSTSCYISDAPDLNIMGIDWIEALQLFDVPINAICCQVRTSPYFLPSGTVTSAELQRYVNEVKTKYSVVFEESLGLCTKAEAVLHLKPGVQPVFKAKRPVPYAAYPAIDSELKRLEEQGVIQKVDFSQWAAPIVAVKKANGSIRICGDFSTGLNRALQSNQYPLPLPDDIFATLAGGKFFSTIDLADAYLQIPVSEDSRHLLTVNTHRGLYQYRRLPFGVKSAPGIFQGIMCAMLSGLEGVTSYLDDVIVVAKSAEEHRVNLNNVFTRLKEWGFRVKYEKCSFFLTSVNYLGFIIDQQGRRPDPGRISAIANMPEPTDATTLRSFLGMINFYCQFISDMREIRAPLDKLLTKNARFQWNRECQMAFKKAKEALQSDLMLAHFDPAKKIIVAGDASQYGIGGVIMHEFPDGSKKPIAHASRSLTPAERNYSQTEKEALALIFCVKKFHRMIYGRKFSLFTDHQPLLAIFGAKKGIPAYTANRWALTLMGYDFDIEYKSTSKFGYADTLSRLIKRESTVAGEDFVIASVKLEAAVNRVLADAIHNFPITAEIVKRAALEDAVLRKVLRYIRSSWPAEMTGDPSLRMLFNRRDALSETQGCILLQDKVVIPLSLQKEVLRELHKGHPGIVRMKALARSYVYWPNIDRDIAQLVRQCSACAAVAPAPGKSPLASWPKPTKPWSRIHMDYAGPFHGQMFLIIVDAFSKWPEIFAMGTATSKTTIEKLKEVFGRFGLPDILVSDNGTQFTSHEFQEFCKRGGIQHIRTAPFHPQSNGQAEKFVDTFKRGMKKLEREEAVPAALQTFLHSYRTTPNAQLPNQITPAEAMLGRRIKVPLDLLRPRAVEDLQRDYKMELQFNRKHGAQPGDFQPDDPVYVRETKNGKYRWVPGVILKKIGLVMFAVKVGCKTWRRHQNQLRRRFSEAPLPDATATFELSLFDDDVDDGEDSNSKPPDDGEEKLVEPASSTRSGEPMNNAHNTPTQGQGPESPRPSRPVRSRFPPRRLDVSRAVDGRYLYK